MTYAKRREGRGGEGAGDWRADTTRFQRYTSNSTRARQLYADAILKPMRLRSVWSRKCEPRRRGAVWASSPGRGLHWVWWRCAAWAAPGDFGPVIMPLDEALDFIATESFFWIGA